MDYPLIFQILNDVAGRGFLAGVMVEGRALMAEEDGRWWVYGVDPGPLAGSGQTPMEAYHSFRQALQEVLFDSAADAQNYEAFKADVEHVLRQRDEADANRWERARQEVRAGAEVVESLKELPRKTGTVPINVLLVRLDSMESQQFSPSDNKVDALATAA